MNTTTNSLASISQNIGLVLMTAAATIGMIELPEHPRGKLVVPDQPAFAVAAAVSDQGSNALRREKEESGVHYVSYSAAQRTPGRTGRF